MFGPNGCCAPYIPESKKEVKKVSKLTKFWRKVLAALSHIIPVYYLKQWRKIKGFRKVQFPIVRRVFGGLIPANEIVAIQPMSEPLGLIFFLDFVVKSRYGWIH